MPIDKLGESWYNNPVSSREIALLHGFFWKRRCAVIYADHAATTAVSPAAIAAMIPYLDTVYGNPSSPHLFGQRAKAALEDARSRIAHCLHADAKEIYFTSGGSEADNQALRTAAMIGAANGKRHIVSAAFEHHAVLHTLDALVREGFTVTLLPVPEDGILPAADVAAALREDTALVSVMYANNEIGTVQPAAEIGAVCRKRGVLFHTDAVQAAGHLPLDVQADCIDLLAISAHKFHGPKGIGVLYARRGITPQPLIFGGGQERGRRAGTENVPAIMGMAAALEEATAHLPENTVRLTALRDRIIAGLRAIPQSCLNGDAVRRLPANIHFSFAGIEGESLLMLLDSRGICASAGSACASGSTEPSHVLTAIGRSRALANGSLRLSIGEECTEADADCIVQNVQEIVSYLREAAHWNEN
ncbi:MAG TPA: cysteine desulfurase NifS [Ruminococcus sp.]|nr:cysteine desulfurase NifS [Ruminococcus sp.]